MKKVYSKSKYVKWKHSSATKSLKSKNYRSQRNLLYRLGLSQSHRGNKLITIPAPKQFRLIQDSETCLSFFKRLRDNQNHNYRGGMHVVKIGLKGVEEIDYCTVSVLKALLNDFDARGIVAQGDSPTNPNVKKFLTDSGFYDGLHDAKNMKINIKGDTDRLFFTKGSGKLSDDEDKALTNVLKKIRLHLTGEKGHCPQLRTIILEICGNSIEHSSSYNNQWTFGVKYEKEKVIITLVDTGRGILRTLYRRLGRKFQDFMFKNEVQILKGAFEKKYESKTRDENRNKGLPVIEKRSSQGFIKNLVVITNNVVLSFDNPDKSKMIDKNFGFDGTIFKLELDKTCF